jgi:UDP-N-acetylmuramate--L-alanine ligase
MNLETLKKIYFVGIGGIGMSAAAGLVKERGFEVTGSDSGKVYSPSLDVLESSDIDFEAGYSEENIKQSDADIFILSAGEDESNPEVKYIVDHKLEYYSYPELLYEMAKEQLRIVVTGTHGKSTTSGFLGYTLKNIDDSSFLTGAVLQNTLSNFHAGSGHYFVFEGDEYKALYNDPTPKFHLYKPDMLVLTNLEFDHPDVFTSLDHIKAEFDQLIINLPEDGLIIYNADNVYLSDVVYKSEVAKFSFGIHNPADYKAENIVYSGTRAEFDVVDSTNPELKTEHYNISLPGEINVYNALACIASLRSLGFSQELIAPVLEDYKGLKRRFEVVSNSRDITVIDDYAHHPTAIKQTLAAAKNAFPGKKIWTVFEPHTFSRTEALLPELAESFGDADKVLISEIYPAREKLRPENIISEAIIKAIRDRDPKFKNPDSITKVENKAAALKILQTGLQPGDVVIVMAVGNFNELAYDIASSIK